MKRLVGVFASIACALAICFALVGCGSGSGSVDATKFVGVWNLSSIEAASGGTLSSVPESDIELMQSLGMKATLTLNADGTAELDLFGEVTEGEWSNKDGKGLTMAIEGQDVELTIEDDGRLKMTQGTDAIFFKNANDASASQSDADNADQGGTSAADQGADASSSDAQGSSDSTGDSAQGTGDAASSQDSQEANGSSSDSTQGGSDSSGSTQATIGAI